MNNRKSPISKCSPKELEAAIKKMYNFLQIAREKVPEYEVFQAGFISGMMYTHKNFDTSR